MMHERRLDWWLAVFGAALPILYIPNGVFHIYLGKVIYARDLALAGHLFLSFFCLLKTGHLRALQNRLLPLLIACAFFAPLFLSRHSLKDGIIAVKWYLLWTDALVTGYFLFLQRRVVKTAVAAAMVALGLIALDATIGEYELWTNSFFFSADKGDETDAGVQVSRSQELVGQVRVQGMQRDVFTFSNFMGVGCVTCICLFVVANSWLTRIGALLGGSYFLQVLWNGGGRSPLFGIALAGSFAGLALLFPGFFQRRARIVLVCAVIGGSLICLNGLSPVLELAFSAIGTESRTLNLASTYDRDLVWSERLTSMAEAPMSFVVGTPFSDWGAGSPPSVTFADNQLLWFLYHTGIIGTVAMLSFLFLQTRPRTREIYPKLYITLILYVSFVVGEGLARESMLLFGALPMFVFIGFFVGADLYADEKEESLEVEEFWLIEDEEALEPVTSS